MTDKIKNLEDLKSLFPEMESYKPDPMEQQMENSDKETGLTEKEKAQMKLYVSRDKKHRGGKQVTLIEGHTGPSVVLEKMLSTLKSQCSAGGSLKDGELIIQGDHVRKVIAYLLNEGYKQTKQKGG